MNSSQTPSHLFFHRVTAKGNEELALLLAKRLIQEDPHNEEVLRYLWSFSPEGENWFDRYFRVLSINLRRERVEKYSLAGQYFPMIRMEGYDKIELGDYYVRYDRPLSEKIAAAKLDHVDERITADAFPYEPERVERTTLVRLWLLGMHRVRAAVMWDALSAVPGLEAELGDLAEGLELARRHPDLQRKMSIALMGSHTNERVAVLSGDESARSLVLKGGSLLLDEDCLILAGTLLANVHL